ncbi:MAG: hypothetical protein LBJ25_07560 [Candidatus Margulisbacteria bacterium]|jgi:hypothetical protein|nr:hypothetical protein [Candidatus Margulisiibacteriota bacterium]
MTIATGKPMLASDMLNLAFFPKGAILMYDGTSWQDNVTLKGWYKCEGQTVDGYGVLPDLKNRFIIGYDATNTPQRSKDNNSVTASGTGALSAVNLPKHSHPLKNENITITGGVHLHGFGATNIATSGGAHSHAVSTNSTTKTLTGNLAISTYYTSATGVFKKGVNTDVANWNASSGTYSTPSYDIDVQHDHGGVASNESPAHTHTVNLSGTNTSESTSHTHTLNLNGKATSDTGSDSPPPFNISVNFDNRPSYYALIYIIKATAAGS